MAQTQRKPVYIHPEHHEILRKIAFEQRCNLSDVLDSVLEQANWEEVAKQAGAKPLRRAAERGGTYQAVDQTNATNFQHSDNSRK